MLTLLIVDIFTSQVLYCNGVEVWRKQSTLSTNNGQKLGSSHTATLSGDRLIVEEGTGGREELSVGELCAASAAAQASAKAGLDVPSGTLGQQAAALAQEKAVQVSSTAFAQTKEKVDTNARIFQSLCIGTLLFRISSYTVAPTRAQLIVRIRIVITL